MAKWPFQNDIPDFSEGTQYLSAGTRVVNQTSKIT